MAKAQKKASAELKEIGATGLSVYSGRLYEESLVKLAGDGWSKTLRDMLNDATINSILIAVEMLVRQVSWDIKPFSEDKEHLEDADFIRGALFDDMVTTWQDTLSEILTFLPWGWSFHEICYKHRQGESQDKTKNSRFTDGKLGWRKFAVRAQESLTEWKFDDFNEVIAMEQQPAPDFKTRTIPIQKALHFRTSSSKDNPEGRSILRGAYREWYFKVHIQNIEGIGIERDLAGLPVLKCPPELFAEDATANQKALLNSFRQMVKEIRRDESEGIVMPQQIDPESKVPLYDFQLLSTGGRRQFDTSAILDRCDQRILMSVLADFLMLGSKSVGSYALSTDKTEIFTSAMSAWLDSICETINRQAIPQLQKFNGRSADQSPKLIHGEVERVSLGELGEFLSKTAGVDLQLDGHEIAWIKAQAGIPVTPESVKKKAEKENSEKDEEDNKDENDGSKET